MPLQFMKCKRPLKPKTAKVIKPQRKQTGKSIQARDKPRKALKPGKRLSRNKKVYYEARKNRSDRKGKIKKTFCS